MAADNTAPTTPVLGVDEVNDGYIVYSWTAATDTGSGVASYSFEYGTSATFNPVTATSLAATVLGYTVDSLVNGTPVYARVQAVDASTNTSPWSEFVAMPNPPAFSLRESGVLNPMIPSEVFVQPTNRAFYIDKRASLVQVEIPVCATDTFSFYQKSDVAATFVQLVNDLFGNTLPKTGTGGEVVLFAPMSGSLVKITASADLDLGVQVR